MNKKANTLLFVLIATLFNILVAILGFVVLMLLYIRFLIPVIPESGYSWGFSLIFIAAIAISFFVYRALMKYLINKVDVEKYFDPIFFRKHKK